MPEQFSPQRTSPDLSGAPHLYAIALGSNRAGRGGRRPDAVLRAALQALDSGATALFATSPVIASRPVGPSRRRYANAAALVATRLDPPTLLTYLKTMEARAGRRRGQRWGARVLDLDILLWSGGMWAEPGLTVPHPMLRQRAFVLTPLAQIAGAWRDPISGLAVRHLAARLSAPKPVDRHARKR